MQPIVGLRQGCNLSPMIFRRVLSDVMATLKGPWEERGFGLDIAECRLLYVAWSDDTWLVAKLPAELNVMIRELRTAARSVGLELRLNKCKWAEVRRKDQPATRVSPEHAELSTMDHSAGAGRHDDAHSRSARQHDRGPCFRIHTRTHCGQGVASLPQQGPPLAQPR